MGRGRIAYSAADTTIVAAQPSPWRPVQVAASGPENHSMPVKSRPTTRPTAHAVTAVTAKPPVYQ